MCPDHDTVLQPRQGEKGFTLIEILVAMTILAVAIGVLSNLFQTSIRQASTATDIRRATQLAESQLTRFGKDLPLQQGQFSGPSQHGLYWEADISLHKPVDEENSIALYRVEINVLSEHGMPIPIRLTTFRLGGP